MTGQTQASDLDLALASLDGLTREQITDLIKAHVSPRDAEAFAVLLDGLSADAVRFLSARALVRLRLVRPA
jgi:hypothetical protein